MKNFAFKHIALSCVCMCVHARTCVHACVRVRWALDPRCIADWASLPNLCPQVLNRRACSIAGRLCRRRPNTPAPSLHCNTLCHTTAVQHFLGPTWLFPDKRGLVYWSISMTKEACFYGERGLCLLQKRLAATNRLRGITGTRRVSVEPGLVLPT